MDRKFRVADGMDVMMEEQTDGTYAERMAMVMPGISAGPGNFMPVVVCKLSSEGEAFPDDSMTEYEYDSETQLNIKAIVKTTPDGRVFRQEWVRNGQAQLAVRSAWVKQP